MSDNYFDDNIRKKLESIRPEYSEAAWQKLKRSLPVPWYLSFLRDFGGWIFGGVATVAFLTTYNNNQNIRKENQLLNDKISTINTSPETNFRTDTIYVRQSDTVYLTKYVTRYIHPKDGILNNDSDELVSKLGSDKSNIGTRNSKNTGLSSDEKSGKSRILNREGGFVGISSNDKSRTLNQKDGFVGISSKEKQTELPNQKINADKNNSSIQDKALPRQTITEDKIVAMVPEEKVVNNVNEEKSKSIVTEDKVAAMVKDDSTNIKKVEDLIIPEKKMADPLDAKTKNFSLKNINARFGISGDYMGEHSRSLGPAIEVFLGERFGFNTGLLLTGKTEFEFRLPRDFNMGTGKKFEDRYKPFIEEKPVRIEDIHIQTSSVKLPLYFNYYVPLKYRTSFMITTGTKLDLSVIETVNFTGQDIFGTPIYNKFENQYKPKIFNNLFYGMGIQYQYKRFAGQLSPYFEFSFGQASYLVPPKSFGINTSLKFNLKK